MFRFGIYKENINFIMSLFRGIVAMAKNRVIGKDSSIPFYYKEDLKFFKSKTFNSNIIVGRKTYENLPVLFQRNIWVLTKNNNYGWTEKTWNNPTFDSFSNIHIVENIEELPEDKDYWVAGGTEIYSLFIDKNLISEFFVTQIIKEYEGNKIMPEFEDKFSKNEIVLTTKDFDIVRYYNE